jgi:hypothetical protein
MVPTQQLLSTLHSYLHAHCDWRHKMVVYILKQGVRQIARQSPLKKSFDLGGISERGYRDVSGVIL